VHLVREIVAKSNALKKYELSEIRPTIESLKNNETLLKEIGDLSYTIYHPVGTCK
jgi:hypothetical protein